MGNEILVTYASKHGATAEIAERIGEVLRDQGLAADVLDVGHVSSLAGYGAVIAGSAVYIGQWRKEVVKFLEEHEAQLVELPLWLFSSGPTGEGDPVELLQGWHYPEKMQPLIDELAPRGIAVFHGDLDPADLNFLERTIIKNVKAPVGDFRDWQAIEAWAKEIAEELAAVG